ncbi:hypothetical protein BCR37DRAFT_378373 [Protomyces lactucae-debilis]|uniref:Impact N-terminal domain-containing protein n=1 Tax=Protomyces lactucae-debilis TaxID=2754530 RepID=A0A1Y2FLW8_PROLT|nr:uncharacterized protein BCR37DRAFT_378373 [Protomyces lactucae-debilis]ORY84354.1 hypothetical protein BCR37DRAFT_378373 [Protomyces lactucae-debilis]
MKRSYDAYAGKAGQAQSLSSSLNKRAQLPESAVQRQAPKQSTGSPLPAHPFEGWPLYTGISDPLHDRKSIFVGYYFPLETTSEANRLLNKFKKSPLVQGADHVMSAWRVYADGSSTSGQTTLDAFTAQAKPGGERQIITGGDDDGERFSSEKLISLLATSNTIGLMVCTRVYGGIMLGPARFAHITRVCQDAHTISRNKRILAQRAETSEEAERSKCLRQLKARDMSIASIRSSLARSNSSLSQLSASPDRVEASLGVDKSTETPLFAAEEPATQGSATLSPPSTPKSKSQQNDSAPLTPSSPSASKTQEVYAQKSLETLKRLLAARDLTIQILRAKLKSSPVKTPQRSGPLMDDVTASQQRTHNAKLFLSDVEE